MPTKPHHGSSLRLFETAICRIRGVAIYLSIGCLGMVLMLGCNGDVKSKESVNGTVRDATQTRPRLKVDATSGLDEMSAEVQKAVQAAIAELEADLTGDQNVLVRATEQPEGYAILFEFFDERHEDGSPALAPGSHCLVVVSEDFKVIDVIGGQ